MKCKNCGHSLVRLPDGSYLHFKTEVIGVYPNAKHNHLAIRKCEAYKNEKWDGCQCMLPEPEEVW